MAANFRLRDRGTPGIVDRSRSRLSASLFRQETGRQAQRLPIATAVLAPPRAHRGSSEASRLHCRKFVQSAIPAKGWMLARAPTPVFCPPDASSRPGRARGQLVRAGASAEAAGYTSALSPRFSHGRLLHGGGVIETWKKRIRECRARAEELRGKAESASDDKERAAALHDAEMWDRMADWEEKNPPS
jgi:hypothetical protein